MIRQHTTFQGCFNAGMLPAQPAFQISTERIDSPDTIKGQSAKERCSSHTPRPTNLLLSTLHPLSSASASTLFLTITVICLIGSVASVLAPLLQLIFHIIDWSHVDLQVPHIPIQHGNGSAMSTLLLACQHLVPPLKPP